MTPPNPQMALQTIIQVAPLLPLETARRQELFEVAGLDPEDGYASEPYAVTQQQIGVAIRELRKAAREIKSLRSHAHEWSREDFCGICGADGRA